MYPKTDAPNLLFDPHCYCLLSSKIDLNPKLKPRLNPKAEQAFLAELPGNEAAQVAESLEKHDRILAGKATVEEVYNEGKDELYQWPQVGDVASAGLPAQTTAMPQVHPDLLRSGDTAAIQAAEALVKALTVPEWGTRTFKAGKMTQRTLDEFTTYQHIPEIRSPLESIRRGDPVDGLLLKWAKRRYPEKEAAIQTPDDLNQWFEQVLRARPRGNFASPCCSTE